MSKVGGLCAAKVNDEWQRVEVVEVNDSYVTVNCLDSGNEETVDAGSVMDLDEKFTKLAAQGVNISLGGLGSLDAEDPK